MIYRSAAGDVPGAIAVAERLEAARPGHRMAALVLTAEAMQEGDFAGAAARLKADPGAYHPLVGSMLSAWAAFGLGDDAAAEAAFGTLEDRAIFTYSKGGIWVQLFHSIQITP